MLDGKLLAAFLLLEKQIMAVATSRSWVQLPGNSRTDNILAK